MNLNGFISPCDLLRNVQFNKVAKTDSRLWEIALTLELYIQLTALFLEDYKVNFFLTIIRVKTFLAETR